MDARLGIFAVPNAGDRPSIVEQVVAADRAGVEIAGIQDHPYQRRYHDTWTLMSYLAGEPSGSASSRTSSTCRFACPPCSRSRLPRSTS